MEFKDILVSPYTSLLLIGPHYHRGGPHWLDWDSQTDARHNVAGKPFDTEPEPAVPMAVLNRRIAWGGPVVRHFGHLIADFSMRLFPTIRHHGPIPVAFSMHPLMGIDSLERVPAYARAIWEWCGVTEPILLTQPTRITSLVVEPQAEQIHHPGPTEEHLDALDAHTERELGPARPEGVVYVSRAAQRGRYAGEAYIEEALAAAGVTVVRPETLPVRESLRVYRNAARLIFAEGSAIHATQLMGRALGEVLVIQRRQYQEFAPISLAPRARSLRYVNATRAHILGLNVGGKPAPWYGTSVLDETALLTAFREFDIEVQWHTDRFAAAVNSDIADWLASERQSPRWSVPGAPEFVAARLREAGLGRLM